MNRQIDLEITRAVRRVLVRHWIDLGTITIRTSNCAVRVFGILRRLDESKRPLTPNTISTVFDEIKRIRAIRHLRAEFQNWSYESGSWVQIDSDNPGRRPVAFGQ